MDEHGGRVFLVGAGPGAVDLITVRGVELLSRADVVIYDQLVNPTLLAVARSSAELVYAGRGAEGGDRMSQAELNRLMVERARTGLKVVRLKGGDPFIFGRGGEEAEALAQAGVGFEVVPGVTSAIAAPEFAGIPLTHRDHGSFVAFLTGRERRRKDTEMATPWDDLARAASHHGTLVILMAAKAMRSTIGRLSAAGLSAETPACAVQAATTAAQRTVLATLGTLADRAERAGIGSPSVIVVGECAGFHQRLNWLEKMPLFGRRVVVTRARARASEFSRELRALGAEVIEFPTIETAEPTSYAGLDDAISRLGEYDWIVFTSATGVEAFMARLSFTGTDIRRAARARIAAIGPSTAARLKDFALRVDVTPDEFRAEALADAIGPARIRGKRFLIPRAETAREALPDLLHQHGAREVKVVAAYKTVRPAPGHVERMGIGLRLGEIDLVTFTSSSTVENFVALAGDGARGLPAAVIGPITAETARRLGFEVVVEPTEYTVAALVESIREYFAGHPRGTS